MTLDNFHVGPVVCVDFDGTIVDEVRWPEKPAPKPGVQQALQGFRDQGFCIKIYSARNNPRIRNQKERYKQMVQLLSEYKIPYDEIVTHPKPITTFYIDDRAIRFENWEQVIQDVETISSSEVPRDSFG
jgi:hypothetical protein